MMSAFLFLTDPASLSDEEALLLRVPVGMDDKSKLLDWFAKSLKLPTYFGSNWDAFEECLRDLSWLEQKKVIIAHRDVPLAMNRQEQQAYLELLGDVVRDWESDPVRTLIVTFDPASKRAVDAAICGTR